MAVSVVRSIITRRMIACISRRLQRLLRDLNKIITLNGALSSDLTFKGVNCNSVCFVNCDCGRASEGRLEECFELGLVSDLRLICSHTAASVSAFKLLHPLFFGWRPPAALSFVKRKEEQEQS